jgi:repressor LexA
MRMESLEIGEAVRRERTYAGFTLAALSERLGLSKSYLSLLECGHRTISPELVGQIEQVLGIIDGRLSALLNWKNTPNVVREQVENQLAASVALADRLRQAAAKGESLDDLFWKGELRDLVTQAERKLDSSPSPLRLRRIPIINRVAAGYPREFTDLDYPASVADDYLSCPEIADPHAFAARVVGDSMEPYYNEGDVVVFSPEKEIPEKGGYDCFVRLERDNETTFKRVFFQNDGAQVRLKPINPKYRERIVDRELVTGLWPAVYVVRPVRHEDPLAGLFEA